MTWIKQLNPTIPADAQVARHVPVLDGLRGIASFWVLLAHVQMLSGLRYTPVLSWGGLAVDLFMLISGFLMTHQYMLRRDREPWEARSSWSRFWLRRFFRIAPLYYVMLFVSLAAGAYLWNMREILGALYEPAVTLPERYLDMGFGNVFMHLSFLFGMVPHYAFRTPLPDWSIGLEMQFYFVFPFLILLCQRIGIVAAGLLSIGACLALRALIPGYFEGFAMPAFLPIKLYMFFIGMWAASARVTGSMRTPFVVAVLICFGTYLGTGLTEALARLLMVVGFFYLFDNGSLWRIPGVDKVRAAVVRVCSSRPAVFLGDTSYAVYLVHLLVLMPVAGNFALRAGYRNLAEWERFGLCFVIATPIIYALAWVLHLCIERPGISMGRSVVEGVSRAWLPRMRRAPTDGSV
ncbi:acyltransferase family protein [Uliginosibacterium sp. sgz301328]|uniref:acyltransferase family protein n=1 Tax=Uliginosibacterium sp. sgz301328 TaxID=3243764 RepID=UPI00359D4EF3